MVTIKTGNLLHAKETIIGHQVNCCGAAGGLAASVFTKYPAAANDYHQFIQSMTNLGAETHMLGLVQLTGQQKDGHIIANLFGQFWPGADYRPEALKKALGNLAEQAKALNKSVALPWRLSCGICGGDWDEVLPMIEKAMAGVECTIYRREGDK